MCFDFLYNFVWSVSHSKKNERNMMKNVSCLHTNYPLFLADFNWTWIFLTDLNKTHNFQTSLKFIHWELICSKQTDRHIYRQAGRQTDNMTDRETDNTTDRHGIGNSQFSQFCESTLKSQSYDLTTVTDWVTVTFLWWWLKYECIKYNLA